MTKYIAIGAAVLILALGGAVWFLHREVNALHERTGKLEESNKQLTETVNAKIKAAQGRGQTDNAVRKLAPPDKLERLR